MDPYGSNYQLQYVHATGGTNEVRGIASTRKNYEEAHSRPEMLSIKQQPEVDYNRYDHYLSISSSNRPATNYPLHYDYRINLDSPYKNVKKIELISAIFPNSPSSGSGASILTEPFFIVDVEELNYIEFPNNVGSKDLKGFAILPLKTPTQSSGGFIVPELGCIYHKSKVFKTPLASLNSISIKIRDYNGDLYDFGVPAGSTDKQHQNHFVFKITVEEVSRKPIQQRNVY